MSHTRVFACVLALAVLVVPTAEAAVKRTVTDSDAKARSCFKTLLGDRAGTEVVRTTATKTGLVRARLKGRGDWDVGVFDAKTRRSVAASAGFRSNELAEGFVTKGQRLVVQACRFRGKARSARLSVDFLAAPKGGGGTVQVVDVATADRAAKKRLQGLGLDLTEHGDGNSLEVVLHGKDDAAKLRAAKFRYTVRIADLAARTAANRRADAAYAAGTARSDLPSGRDSYRRLADYELELKQLARKYPKLVKPITLAYRTHLGRDVIGIEIAKNPLDTRDGKPIFLNMGVHHAREWPSSEHAIEWAYDLLRNYGKSNRTTRLVNATRNIVIPIVNPDGFNISREGSRPPGTEPFSRFDYEMKRKNCWPDPANPGPCDNNPTAGARQGVDPNRNYGGFWGGSGASLNPLDETYRGTGPFSEPESQNVRKLVGERQVTNLITNHTYSNLLLRVPGVADVGFPLEEPQYKALGAKMAAHNGYSNIPGFGLYDTTGGTEDWTFWSAGPLSYTFEIGPDEFHPPYETGVVAEYLGKAPAEGAGKGGNRAAYYDMLEATVDQSLHSVLTGRAPENYRLRIHKSFMTSTSPVWNNDFGTDIGDPILFPDTLSSEFKSKGGRFEWDVNPSTRPVVRGRSGRDATGPPQGPIDLANPDGIPAENTSYPDEPFEAIPFTVQGPPNVDNGKMTVHIEWSNPETDWDLYIVNSAGEVVTQSASFGDTTEDATLFDPPPGEYTAHVVNYDQVQDPFDDWTGGQVTFASPKPTTYGPQEAWQLTCSRPNGREVGSRSIIVDRGQRVDVGNVCGGQSQAAKAKGR
jgi:hypothetical protein